MARPTPQGRRAGHHDQGTTGQARRGHGGKWRQWRSNPPGGRGVCISPRARLSAFLATLLCVWRVSITRDARVQGPLRPAGPRRQDSPGDKPLDKDGLCGTLGHARQQAAGRGGAGKRSVALQSTAPPRRPRLGDVPPCSRPLTQSRTDGTVAVEVDVGPKDTWRTRRAAFPPRPAAQPRGSPSLPSPVPLGPLAPRAAPVLPAGSGPSGARFALLRVASGFGLGAPRARRAPLVASRALPGYAGPLRCCALRYPPLEA